VNGYDLHTHTDASFDSRLSLDDYIVAVNAAGLTGVAVTDHDTIIGALRLRDRRPPFEVIIGSEITLIDGVHLIGLYLDKPILGGTLPETASAIRAQGGLVLLPHPYRADTGLLGTDPTNGDAAAIMQHIDLIEVFNAKSPSTQNRSAAQLAERWGKAVSAGSDAHRAAQLGTGRIRLSGPQRSLKPRRLLHGPIRIMGIDMTKNEISRRHNRREGLRRLMLRFKQSIPNEIWRWGKTQWEQHCDRRDASRPRQYREYGRFPVPASDRPHTRHAAVSVGTRRTRESVMHDMTARGNHDT
jgi:hypothetical protein